MPSDSFGLAARTAPRHEAVVAVVAVAASEMTEETPDDLAVLVNRLVDAIDVRESVEPDVPHWEVGALIRELERELAREWGASRRWANAGSMTAGGRP